MLFSPSSIPFIFAGIPRVIHTSAGEEYRPIAEIVEELDALDEEATDTHKQLKAILTRMV